MKNKIVFSLTVASLLSLSGCASNKMKKTVEQRAKFDLQCESVALNELSPKTWGVTGCGQQATYLINGPCDKRGDCQAILNSANTPLPQNN